MLDALKLDAGVAVEDEKDTLGGGGAWETDVYDVTLKAVYLDTSKSGAIMANAILVTADGRKITETECIMSKKSGELKSTYIDQKTKKPVPLPGYAKFLTLFRTIGKPEILDLSVLPAEKRVLPLYDFDAKRETNQEKTVFTDSINVKLKAAVQKVIEDKKTKQGDEYVATGETREVNTVRKWFNEDGKTLQEIKDGTEAKFMQEWLDAFKGKTVDKSTKNAGNGTAGAPASAAPTQTLDL